MKIFNPEPDLYLISLSQQMPGFENFITAWLYKGEKTILVDPGPASTIPDLFDALDELDVKTVDVVLLTHIHIDHAGGLGEFSAKFTDTPIVCHSKGIPHIADPSRLWEGSLKILGKTAETYGPIQPVDPTLLIDASSFSDFDITPCPTPGHAPHHISYLCGSILFAGEVCGVRMALEKPVKWQGKDFFSYLRPATPPKFFLETSLNSIDYLSDFHHEIYCFGHFGSVRYGNDILAAHREQLKQWADIIENEMKKGVDENFSDRCIAKLLKKDPLLAGLDQFSPDIRARERHFMNNSIKGFRGYLSAG
ncbi:MBL fold metallo-hydrolase [Desulfobacterales bacterium HSG16]|nr:MBL fold metallo-hydrolase [Desulfobacterales bacterium HSG16]